MSRERRSGMAARCAAVVAAGLAAFAQPPAAFGVTLADVELAERAGARCHPAVTQVVARANWGTREAVATDGGLIVLPPAAGPAAPPDILTTCTGLPSQRLTALAVHGPELLVATLDRGVVAVREDTSGRFAVRALPGLENVRATALAVAPDGALLVGTADAGLWRWTTDETLTHPPGAPRMGLVSAVRVDAARRELWIGRGPKGATRIDAAGRSARRLKGLFVRGFRETPGGLMAETPAGLCALTGRREPACRWSAEPAALPRGLPPGPPSNHVTALTVFAGALWVGTFNHGLASTRDGYAWQTVDPAQAPDALRYVNGLATDAGQLFVASPHGLVQGDGRTWRVQTERDGLPDRHVNAVVAAGRGVWLGTARGAAFLDGSRVTLHDERAGLPHRIVYALAPFGERGVIAGTQAGLGVFDGRRWSRITQEDGRLADNWVNAVAAFGGALWAGTYDAGIDRMAPDGGAAHVGPPAAWVNPGGLVDLGGVLLVATLGDGLLATDGVRWRSFAAPSSSLPDADVTAAAVFAGRLWIGTRAGLVSWPLPAPGVARR